LRKDCCFFAGARNKRPRGGGERSELFCEPQICDKLFDRKFWYKPLLQWPALIVFLEKASGRLLTALVELGRRIEQMFHLTYEFKLKPTTRQIEIFENWLEQCRRVYNYALAERKHWFGSRSCQINACSIRSEFIISAETKRPTYASQCKSLTTARANIPALSAVAVHVLQQTLKRLEKAFVSMWEQKHGFLRFKKAGNMRSFVFPQLGVEPVGNQAVKLPKIGLVKFHQSRPIPDGATIKQARVVRRVSGWYVMLTLQWDVSVPDLMPHGEGIGIDIGLTNFIATSNGLIVKRQKFFIDAERKLKLLQKSVSLKKIGSNNWRKAQKKVALLHEYVTNCRKDWHRKLSHQICKDVGMIFVEDLNLIMLSRGMLGKHCLDASWG